MPSSSPPTASSRQVIHRGRKFDFELITAPGRDGKPLQREVVRHPGAVVIVPVLDDGRLVLIRNYRIAVEAWLYEFPAGTLDPRESPEACARRELAEETGYQPEQMLPLASFYTTPGLTDERMHAFLAQGLRPAGGGQKLEDDEQIEVHPVTVTQALDMLDRGELLDGKSIVALLLALRRGLLPPAEPAGKGA